MIVFLRKNWAKIQLYIFFFFYLAVVLMICVTKVARGALEKALAEDGGLIDGPGLPIVSSEPTSDLVQPLVVKIEPLDDTHEK